MAILMGMNITTVVQAQQRDAHELDSIANSVFTADSKGTRAVTAPLKMSLKSSDVLAKGSLTNREAFYIYNSMGMQAASSSYRVTNECLQYWGILTKGF